MKSTHTNTALFNRRAVVTGSIATGFTAIAPLSSTAQVTPAASPAGSIDAEDVMVISAGLCAGAILNQDHVEGLISHLSAEDDIDNSLAELMEIRWFTPEEMAATSPEAQRIARNIMQYWFLGQYDGEPVENRETLFLDLASWQSLPYMTQQGFCKGENYWAEEIEL